MRITLKLEGILEQSMDDLCVKYHTTPPDIFRAYLVWLVLENRVPKGYPREVIMKEDATKEDYYRDDVIVLGPGENIKFPAFLAEELIGNVNDKQQ